MSELWFVKKNGIEHGPFPADELRRRAAEGKITRDALVRQGRVGKWYPAEKVKGLLPEPSHPPETNVHALGNTNQDGSSLDENAENKERTTQSFSRSTIIASEYTPNTGGDDIYYVATKNTNSLDALQVGLFFVLGINAFGLLLVLFPVGMSGAISGVAFGALFSSGISAIVILWIVIRAIAATSCHLKLQARIAKRLDDLMDKQNATK